VPWLSMIWIGRWSLIVGCRLLVGGRGGGIRSFSWGVFGAVSGLSAGARGG